jgi:hypothetical protein
VSLPFLLFADANQNKNSSEYEVSFLRKQESKNLGYFGSSSILFFIDQP